jgi:phosphatidyl-myo-inositol dimannoside synthase
MRNVYARLPGESVTVLTVAGTAPPPDRVDGSVRRVIAEDITAPYWGVLRPAGLSHHWRLARRLGRLAGSAVHCARAIPEGVSAFLASHLSGRPFGCWAHGEDLATAQQSRELAFLTRQTLRRSAFLFANSHHTASMLAAIVPERRQDVTVVHPGVDVERFRPDVPGRTPLKQRLLGDADVLALTVGRLQRRKGHDIVLQALAEWPAGAPRVRYVVVGEGDQGDRLRAMARDLRLEAVVQFAGAVPASELPAYYAAADVFVHPNRVDGVDLEGFGMVFLEAASAGVPTIGGDSGGVPEAIANGETGLLVSGTDVVELREAMLRLVSSPDERTQFGRAGRLRAEREFSWSRAAEQVARVQQGILRTGMRISA